MRKPVTESHREFSLAYHSDLTDPVVDELTAAGPRPADLPAPACPLWAATVDEMAAEVIPAEEIPAGPAVSPPASAPERLAATADEAAGPDAVAIEWRRAAWPGERDDVPPEWYERFRDAWERGRGRGDESGGLPGDLGLAEPARPLLAAARDRLRDSLASRGPASLPDLPDLPDLSGLPDLLCREPPLMWLGMAVGPAVADELAAAAAAGRLDGATPRERYRDFIEALTEPGTALAFWRRHPVLARHVTGLLDDWVTSRLAFAHDLAADLPALAETFAPGEPHGLGDLEEVRFGGAETHRGGRVVALARFAGGTVVYKPRRLAIDRRFDRLLGWFNDGAPPYALRRIRLLERSDHGWSEHVGAAPCARRDLPAYFWRAGALLALTHLLHGYDLHDDNVIAAGDQPVVVDLEALFHTEDSRLMLHRVRLGDPAATRLAESVLGTGLLPGPVVMADVDTERPFGVDLSPLGIAPDRRSLIPIPMIENPDTDRLRIRLAYQTVPASAERLRDADGGTVDPRRFRDDLVAGYTYGYEWLRSAGDRLTALLDACADVPLRLIQLSTFLYVRLLLDSWRPAELRDAAVRERGLTRLAAGWPGVPHRTALVNADLAALRRGEVPTFEVRPGRRDVWLEDGTRLRDVLGRSPLDAVRERYAHMGPEDRAAQIEIIDAGLAALTDPRAAASRTAARSHGTVAAPSSDALVDQAVRIAGRLRKTAVRSGDRIGWLTLEVVDARSRRVAPAGLDLYAGLPGIGLFLSYLSQVTGGARDTAPGGPDRAPGGVDGTRGGVDGTRGGAGGQRNGHAWIGELAVRVADEVAARCRGAAALDPAPRGTTAGVFGPLLGPVYYLAHAAAVHDRPDYAELARDVLLPAVPGVLDRGVPGRATAAGVGEGAAGAVLALLALYAVRPDDGALLEMACAAGDRLLSCRLTGAGFGYGASGAAVALTRLYALAPDARYAAAARALIAGEADPGEDAGWCQGAAGVGLARLELARSPVFSGRRPELLRSLEHAAEIVRTAATPVDDSLCHGRFARLELLTALSTGAVPPPVLLSVSLPVPPDEDRPEEPAWRTAVPAPAPGLLGGLSGVGLGLLRLAGRDAVPAVLGLTPPTV